MEPSLPVRGAIAPSDSSPDLQDYTISGRYVDLYGLTLKSFIEFQILYKDSFSHQVERAVTLLVNGRMFISLFAIYRDVIKGVAIGVKNVGELGYLPSLEERIRVLEARYREWKKDVDQLEDDACRLTGLFYNVVNKWKTPPKEMRTKPSPTSSCVRTFYHYVGSEKERHAEAQKNSEELFRRLMEARKQLEAVHREIVNFFTQATPVHFKTDCFTVANQNPMSRKREALTKQLQNLKGNLDEAEKQFGKFREYLEQWISWCTKAENMAAKDKLSSDQGPHLNALIERHAQLTAQAERIQAENALNIQQIKDTLIWAENKIKEFNQSRERKRSQQEAEEQVGMAKTEDSIFEEGAAQQVHVKAKDISLRFERAGEFLKQWKDNARILQNKLTAKLAQIPPENAENVAQQTESQSWGLISSLSKFKLTGSSTAIEKKWSKVQFSDPPPISPEIPYQALVEANNAIKQEAAKNLVSRWKDVLIPPADMLNNGNLQDDTLEAHWVHFHNNNSRAIFQLLQEVLLELHYPCQSLQADYQRWIANADKLHQPHQKYYYNLELRELNSQVLLPLRMKFAAFKDRIDATNETVKILSDKMEMSPRDLAQPATEEERQMFVEAIARIGRANRAQEALKEMVNFFKKILAETQTQLDVIQKWMEGHKLHNQSIPVEMKQLVESIKSNHSYSSALRMRLAIHPNQVPKASEEARKYTPIRVHFFGSHPSDQKLETLFLQFINTVTPARYNDYAGSIKKRQIDNREVRWKCFLYQAREIRDTIMLYKAFYSHLQQLRWDVEYLYNLDYYEKAGSPQREKDWQELYRRWELLTRESRQWMSTYENISTWLNVAIATYHKKIAQKDWYYSQIELAFRTPKEVERYLNHFTETVAYFEVSKMHLDHLFRQQISPVLTGIASYMNSMQKHQQGAWFTPKMVSNPLLSSQLAQAIEPPAAAGSQRDQ